MKMMRNLIGVSVAVVAIAGLSLADGYGHDKAAAKKAKPKQAIAVIEARSGSKLTGKATFKEADGKVKVLVKIKGAEPGTHAVHIHETGDCSAVDATSTGGHWNPSHEDHGKWGNSPFHHGDIGNIEVGANGSGSISLTTDLWTIGGAPETDILGKAIIVHAKADDFTTQPTGNAGGRFGCGVIKKVGR